eukprot:4757805-Pyramimonas_sp.AAC.1
MASGDGDDRPILGGSPGTSSIIIGRRESMLRTPSHRRMTRNLSLGTKVVVPSELPGHNSDSLPEWTFMDSICWRGRCGHDGHRQ